MGNGLISEARMEVAECEIYEKCRNKYSYKPHNQFCFVEQNYITDTADHAKTRILRQAADYEPGNKGYRPECMRCTGPFFTEEDKGGSRNEKNQ